MLFRQAEENELDSVMAIIEDGRAALAKLDIDQWQGGSPNENMVRADIAEGYTMVAEQDGRIVGTLAFVNTADPDYTNIISGSWLSERDDPFAVDPSNAESINPGAYPTANPDGFKPCEYITLHRVAIKADAMRKGVASFMIQSSIDMASSQGKRSLRVDTHPGNTPMQRLLEHCGLTHCCDIDITLPGEITPRRLGYEILL